jgi:hypothetical protein
MIIFEPYFQKTLFQSFFVELVIFLDMYVKELFRWAFVHWNFISSLIPHNPHLTLNFKSFFSHFSVNIWTFGSVAFVENEPPYLATMQLMKLDLISQSFNLGFI